MHHALTALLQATQQYQAQVDTYDAEIDEVEQACEVQLATLERIHQVDTESSLTMALLDPLIQGLEPTQSAEATALITLRQALIDSQDTLAPAPNYRWEHLRRLINEKLRPMLGDSLALLEQNIPELFENFECCRRQSERSFQTIEPMQLALLRLNQTIEALPIVNPATFSHIENWRQFFSVYAQLAQKMDALTATLQGAFLRLTPLIDNYRQACIAAQQKLIAAGFKHTRPIDLGVTFIFTPHLTSLLSVESQLSRHPPLCIPIDYAEQQAIHRFIDRKAKVCAEALAIRIKSVFHREARRHRDARTNINTELAAQAFFSQCALVTCPAQQTCDHRHFAAKVAEYLNQADLLRVTCQTETAGYERVTSVPLQEGLAQGLASSVYSTIYHHDSSVHLSHCVEAAHLYRLLT